MITNYEGGCRSRYLGLANFVVAFVCLSFICFGCASAFLLAAAAAPGSTRNRFQRWPSMWLGIADRSLFAAVSTLLQALKPIVAIIALANKLYFSVLYKESL